MHVSQVHDIVETFFSMTIKAVGKINGQVKQIQTSRSVVVVFNNVNVRYMVNLCHMGDRVIIRELANNW